jgi:hypothetical protein
MIVFCFCSKTLDGQGHFFGLAFGVLRSFFPSLLLPQIDPAFPLTQLQKQNKFVFSKD